MKIVNNKLLLTIGLILSVSPIFSQEKIRDVRTHPDEYFLRIDEVANSLELLPPPPEPGSILFMYDDARYKWGKIQRETPRGNQAVSDAKLSGLGIFKAYKDAFGLELTPDKTPELYTLIKRMLEDAGDLATRKAKKHYMRKRPFAFYNEDTSVPEAQKSLSTNGSYPSGHTAIGWATALVLAEINPECQDAILKRGYEIGQSRVISGYHFQSDVDAARLVASAVVARLHANEEFIKQLNKAKAEFKKLKSKIK